MNHDLQRAHNARTNQFQSTHAEQVAYLERTGQMQPERDKEQEEDNSIPFEGLTSVGDMG